VRLLSNGELLEIERIVRRHLTTNELREVARLETLEPSVLDIARLVARESTPLAVKYLRELVPNARVGSVSTFLEHLLRTA